jgi:hypothetical protein
MTIFYKKSNLQKKAEKKGTKTRKRASRKILRTIIIWKDNSNSLTKHISLPHRLSLTK